MRGPAMKITIVGAGGIGGYLAARLGPAGHRLTLVARGAHLAAIRDAGLRLVEPAGSSVARPDILTDDPAEGGVADLVVIATKAHQVAPALAHIAPAVGAETAILPFQNGVDAPEQIAARYGAGRAMIGVARILSNITAPGVVTRYGADGRFTLGTADGATGTNPVPAIRAAFRTAGIDVPDCIDARAEMWRKFVLFNALSCVTAGGRLRFGDIVAHPETRALVRRLMTETAALARTEGVDLGAGLVDDLMAGLAKLPPDGRTSTAHDLAGGRPLESAHICEAVVRRAAGHGLAVPASETVAGLLAPYRDGPPR